MGKHKPREGAWIPDPKDKGITILGKITLKLIKKVVGWDDRGR